MDEQTLLRKKRELETLKRELDSEKGELKALMKQLKTEWGCDDLKAAKQKLVFMEAEWKGVQEKIETLSQEIQERMEV